MKDKVVRAQMESLAAILGYRRQPFGTWERYFPDRTIVARVAWLEHEFAALEQKLKDFKDAMRPTCKTCGQKIQDGFQAGDIETLVASVKRTKR